LSINWITSLAVTAYSSLLSGDTVIEPTSGSPTSTRNAKIGWKNDHWNVSVWGKNLTEDEYASQTTITQSFSGQSNSVEVISVFQQAGQSVAVPTLCRRTH
jgi:hypothetical protein